MTAFLLLALTHFLSVILPGPCFIAIINNSLMFGAKNTIKVAIGIGIGDSIFIALAIFGAGTLIKNNIVINTLFNGLAGVYLAFLAFKIWNSNMASSEKDNQGSSKNLIGGVIVAISNPKSIIFYTSLLVAFTTKNTTYFVKIGWLIWMSVSTAVYFIALAFLVSKFRHKLLNYIGYLKKIFASLLLFFSFMLVILALKNLY